MNYREEIETALGRDKTEYGRVWRDETEGMTQLTINRIWKQLNVILERRQVETTPKQKKRWIRRMNGSARKNCLSQITAAEIARRAEDLSVRKPI